MWKEIAKVMWWELLKELKPKKKTTEGIAKHTYLSYKWKLNLQKRRKNYSILAYKKIIEILIDEKKTNLRKETEKYLYVLCINNKVKVKCMHNFH